MGDIICVRLKPYNPLAGNVRIDYVAPWGTKYREGEWHDMPLDTDEQRQAVEYLRAVRQHVTDPHSPPAFDVCTEVQARDIIEAEKRAKLVEAVKDAEPMPVAPRSVSSKPSSSLNRADPVHEIEVRSSSEVKPPTVQPRRKKRTSTKRTRRSKDTSGE
jgi:hypothetical protein